MGRGTAGGACPTPSAPQTTVVGRALPAGKVRVDQRRALNYVVGAFRTRLKYGKETSMVGIPGTEERLALAEIEDRLRRVRARFNLYTVQHNFYGLGTALSLG